ncbi:glutamate 5-kinase [Salsuginibacillus halophilus]|uniref:Glutamate 5-kinase n=1 Tax=Salsuginibacillus halophilus TaxID=517424 RepID=A0A2P8HX60_9BACI|nr:glutamate 5-kinase [Salsuginibacillus halophilus]PSL50797.1 glutamate 5-kinase [Salsuginibacillus halophilus]
MARERIVVKIGSSSLANEQGGLSRTQLDAYVDAAARLKKAGHEVILVSSGAVAAGFYDLGYPTRPVTTQGKQAAAAIGQGQLMQAYSSAFNAHGLTASQHLLTRHNFADKVQYQNMYTTLSELLKRDIIPIINENDTVSVDALTFGDNDMLSALVAGLLHARYLFLLTDIDGIYDKNPKENLEAKKYHFLPDVTKSLLESAGQSGSNVGTGGMRSKLEAAERAVSLGINVFIGKKEGTDFLFDILEGKGSGTYIGHSVTPGLSSKKQWVSLHSEASGMITIDAGAEEAILQKGKSLLPVGVTEVFGSFAAGDVVQVKNEKKQVIGRGQVNMSRNELDEVKGLPSAYALERIQTSRAEVIHQDEWAPKEKERM